MTYLLQSYANKPLYANYERYISIKNRPRAPLIARLPPLYCLPIAHFFPTYRPFLSHLLPISFPFITYFFPTYCLFIPHLLPTNPKFRQKNLHIPPFLLTFAFANLSTTGKPDL